MTASTRDVDQPSSPPISMRAVKSVNRPRTLEIPRCWATAPTVECAGSTVQVPGAGSSVPPCRVSTTVPASARPPAPTSAVEADGP